MNRRLLLVPFTVCIPRGERDPNLARKLEDEFPAILRWILDGAFEWQQRGLTVPEIVRAATADYFADQDSLSQWIDECTIHDPRAFTPTAKLFKSWKSWCERGNRYAGTESAFSDDLKNAGFERDRTKSSRGFKGIMLKPDTESML